MLTGKMGETQKSILNSTGKKIKAKILLRFLQFLQFCHSTIQQHFDPILYHSDTIQLGNQQFNREKNQGLNFF